MAGSQPYKRCIPADETGLTVKHSVCMQLTAVWSDCASGNVLYKSDRRIRVPTADAAAAVVVLLPPPAD